MIRAIALLVLASLSSCSTADERPALNPLKTYWTIGHVDKMIEAARAAGNQPALKEWLHIRAVLDAKN
jgi:hypothetical protein